MADEQQSIVIFGTSWCPDCKRSKQFLGDHRVRYQWVDIEQDSESMAYVEQINNGLRVVSTIVFPDGDILKEPSKILSPEGVFVFIGMSPNSGFLPLEIETDLRGFVMTDGKLQTSLVGVFAAGDVREGATAQAASAAGEGATAALMIRQYLQSIAEM